MAFCGDHVKLVHRINRIGGQVNGLRKMVEEDRDCRDVLKQIAATLGAVRSLGNVVLEAHLRGCVSEAIRAEESEDSIQEVLDLFSKFSK